MEERQILRAFLLTFLVLMVYYVLFPPRAPRPQGQPPSAAAAPSAPAPPNGAGASSADEARVEVTPVAAQGEYRVDVETPQIEVGFKNRGARVVSWKLLRYRDSKGEPEEMVQTTVEGPLPLDISTGDEELDKRLRDALFKASTERLALHAAEQGTLSFDFAEGNVAVHKELVFRGDGYLTDVSVSVRRNGREIAKKVLWGPGIGHPSAGEKAVKGYEDPNGVALVDGKLVQTPVKKIGEGVPEKGLRWIGVEGRHFAALWVPPGDTGAGEIDAATLPGEAGADKRTAAVATVALTTGDPAVLFVGPKDYYYLSRTGHDLVKVVPLGGWIGPIAVFMMSVLRWLYGHIGNYGWSIVALTVLISLIMAPLRHYGIVNGRKMAKMAPELKVIQDRYRKMPALDPRRQEMHKEMSAVYARHGMNMSAQMMVGCLPLLITMPFLFAVYRVLNVSIDLRGAGFLWIPDLSQSDPLFVTPILMGVSMFLMQRMTPTAMDPAQQRMMMIMPIFLLLVVWQVAAGLNLYWFVSNTCSIVQQVITLRLLGQQEAVRRK
jgi:YidC/Oxa1 family membrane protein insertase